MGVYLKDGWISTRVGVFEKYKVDFWFCKRDNKKYNKIKLKDPVKKIQVFKA